MKWKHIASVPKDGTVILGAWWYEGSFEVNLIRWNGREWVDRDFSEYFGCQMTQYPDFWHPIPADGDVEILPEDGQ